MLPFLEKSYLAVLLFFLQVTIIVGAPFPIYQAQPQVMIHNLQQPSPIETLQSLKTQKIKQQLYNPLQLQLPVMMSMIPQTPSEMLQQLAAIQSMQVLPITNQLEMQSPIITPSLLNQMSFDRLQPTNPQLYQEIPIQYNQQHETIASYQNHAEDAIQEIALQQQMLALQQIQALKRISNANAAFDAYQQPEPILILLPDEKKDDDQNENLVKNSNSHDDDDSIHIENSNNEDDTVAIEDHNVQKPDNVVQNRQKGMRKAILLVPNARFSIGGIISQIPWLPIEINVPDTAIWAWNGIYNGISSIISGIGNTWPFNLRPQKNSNITEVMSRPSVKMFLKQLQKNNYDSAVPVFAVPLEGVIPVNLN